MIAALIIVFRETIEAGLIIGIVLAATRGVPRRGVWVAAGIVGGLVGAGIAAVFAGMTAAAFAGTGQEVLNAGILGLAVGMLTWHGLWMAGHGRDLASNARTVGAAVTSGRPLGALAVVVGVAVLREGVEVVLFLSGIAISAGEDALSMAIGGAAGVALAGGVAALIYFGLVRIPASHLFAVTGGLISLLAAGLAAQAVAVLQQAGIVTVFADPLWDSSSLLAEGSLIGRVLHTLVGYSDRPTGLQLAAYLTILGLLGVGAKLLRPADKVPPGRRDAIEK